MNQTTFYQYGVIANLPYDGKSSHSLNINGDIIPIDIQTIQNSDKQTNPPGKDGSNPNFYAETYYNNSTGEVIISFRGTNGIGDMVNWPQVAVGLDTDQTALVQKYVKDVTTALAANSDYKGADITFVGHSYGGLQAQEAQNHLLDMQNGSIDNVSETMIAAASSIGRVRGVGFNAAGPGFFEARDSADFLEVDANFDIVNWGGLDQNGASELSVDTGTINPYNAHRMVNFLDALRNHQYSAESLDMVNLRTLQTSLTALQDTRTELLQQIAEWENDPTGSGGGSILYRSWKRN